MSGFGYDVLGFGSGAGVAPPEVDDEFNRTSFLSHFDGANNGDNNAFDDGSASNHTITANGNVTQGSFGPFARPDGEWAVSFEDGDSLAVASSSDFDFGTGNFTWECFVFQESRSAFQLIMAQDDYSSGNSISCWLTNTGQASIYYEGGGTHYTTTATVPLNTWNHLAWVRKGTGTNEFSIYINGTAEVSGAMNTNFNQDGIVIGQKANGDYDFIGNISNIRIVNGSAVYTGNFTVPTSKLTAVTNTKLLTCQSNRFVDDSASAHTVTPSVNPAVTAFGPFLTDAVYDPAANGASAYFDGSGDYLSTPSQGTLAASANWCMESYVFFTGTSSGTYRVMSSNLSTDSDAYFQMRIRLDKYNFYTDNVDSGLVGTAEYNQWTHMAMTKSGTTVRAFVNGIKLWEATDNGTTVIQNLIIGWGYGSEYFPGYISDARFVNGSSIYTANFTPPAAPLTAITNTSLLLNMADGQAIDSTAQNNLTLYGNAKLSTGKAKFGDTSIVFDGQDTNYAVVKDFAQLNGELTIEFWVNPSGLNPKNGLFQQGFASGGLSARIETDGTLSLDRIDVSNYFGTSTTISANAWTHIALVYYSGVFKCYINGTADSQTSTTSANWTTSGDEFILGARYANGSANNPMTGYLDDFRISNFSRYTSNFTAPDEPFPDQGQV